MPSFKGKAGLWAVFNYGDGPQVVRVTEDLVEAVTVMDYSDQIMFWPLHTSFRDALTWWEKEKANYDVAAIAASNTSGGGLIKR